MKAEFNKVFREMSGFSKVLSHEFPEGSKVKKIAFNYNLRTDHGAPCNIKVTPGDMDSNSFWGRMKAVTRDLNAVPSNIDIRPSEIKQGSDWKSRDAQGQELNFNYPNYRGRHNLGGGDSAYIDTISVQDAIPMLSKAIYGLAEKNVITAQEADDTFQHLFSQVQRTNIEVGLPAVSTKRSPLAFSEDYDAQADNSL